MRCLNPCSNGIWSLTLTKYSDLVVAACLNPCSNGIWSLTQLNDDYDETGKVLILVLMEYGL